MIALYAYHAALMSLLTAIVLIAWDRQRIPPAIFALTILGLVPPALGLLPMTEEDPARFWTAQFLWMISLVILGLAWSRLFPLRGGNAKTMQQRAGALDEFTSALLAATVFLPTAIKFRLLFLSITIVLAIVATLVNRSRAAAVWAATLLTLLGCQSIWRWFE